MNDIGKPEWVTQQRVIQLLRDTLGYQYLGDWETRAGNSYIEEGLLSDYVSGARGTKRDDAAFEAFIAGLQAQPSVKMGEFFVFVDECHRTQSGRLNRVMQALMPQPPGGGRDD